MFFIWKLEKTKSEKSFLFKLIKNYFSKELNNILKQGIKINILGELKKFSKDLSSILKKTSEATNKNKRITVNLAINYGSKVEILQALKKLKKILQLKTLKKTYIQKICLILIY